MRQLENHPILIGESDRYDAVTDSGPAIEAYRGLSEQEVKDMAVQGDSAAMAVLGAMSVMRARRLPTERAVPYLMLEDPQLMSFSISRPFSAEFVGHTSRARHWFYKAALHGRVMALSRVGDAMTVEQGGPVELGWIDKADFDALSIHEKNALIPSNVYNVVAYEVAPQLKSGPIGEILYGLMPRSDRQVAIVDQLATQFRRDLREAGLPPIAVSESDAPPLENLRALLCAREREALENEYENEKLR